MPSYIQLVSIVLALNDPMQMTLSHDQINPSIRSEAAARLDVVTLRLIHRRDEILELKPTTLREYLA